MPMGCAVLPHGRGNHLELHAQRGVLRGKAGDQLVDGGLVIALGCHVQSLSWVVSAGVGGGTEFLFVF